MTNSLDMLVDQINDWDDEAALPVDFAKFKVTDRQNAFNALGFDNRFG